MKVSREIDLRAAQNLKAAAAFAARTNRPLNRFVSISWSLADGDNDPRRRGALLQERARHWLKRKGHDLASIYVHEHDKAKGPHTHIVAHIPQGLGAEFERNLPRWIGGLPVERMLDVRPADEGAVLYMLKDVNPNDHPGLGIPRGHRLKRSTRPIRGKRCGTSQALGPAARRRGAAALDVVRGLAARLVA